MRPPCLVSDVSENDSRFSPLITMLAVGLLQLSLLHWVVSPVFLDSPELLLWRDARFCQWPFRHLVRRLLVSVFGSTYMMIIDFHKWNHPQISEIKKIWSMCLSCVLEFGFQVFYWEFFVSMFFGDSGMLEAVGTSLMEGTGPSQRPLRGQPCLIDSQTLQAIPSALGYYLELKSEILLLDIAFQW